LLCVCSWLSLNCHSLLTLGHELGPLPTPAPQAL
jgi:hypothetical protein